MKPQYPIRAQSRRRGIALVLVVMVMALAAILGYAMLSASATQATAGGNAVAAATARAQAESGIHLAMYYLLNPGNAPSSPPCTWSNVTFATVAPASTIPGSVTIQVGAPSNGCYQVISTGSSGTTSGGGAVTRTITAEISVGGSYQVNEAAAFNSTVTLGSQFSFTSTNPEIPALAVPSTATITNDGNISGNISAASAPGGYGTQTNGTLIPASTIAPAPASSVDLYNYAQAYVYQGNTYTPTLIGATVSSTTSYGPTATNPLGIYYTSGGLTVTQQLNVNGTLVVNGTLTDASKIYITPVASTLSTNMPALVVMQKLSISGLARVMNATGVVYVGTSIANIGSTTTSNITINGALLDAGGFSGYSGILAVNYNSAYTNIPGFVTYSADSSQMTPWVKVISWSE
jgi:Tfp pilus assembly protein PilX/cytoskeletal protein CcmA (bactofilin family)